MYWNITFSKPSCTNETLRHTEAVVADLTKSSVSGDFRLLLTYMKQVLKIWQMFLKICQLFLKICGIFQRICWLFLKSCRQFLKICRLLLKICPCTITENLPTVPENWPEMELTTVLWSDLWAHWIKYLHEEENTANILLNIIIIIIYNIYN